VLDVEVLIVKLFPSVDASRPRTISSNDIPTLDHKVFDDTVEGTAGIALPIHARITNGRKIPHSLWNSLTEQANPNGPHALTPLGNLEGSLLRDELSVS